MMNNTRLSGEGKLKPCIGNTSAQCGYNRHWGMAD
jgi:hypothetical protein